MIDKKQIESILRINGLPPTAPEEEIRSVLISSRYNNDEIETAFMVLRENPENNKSHVEGLHKVFRTDTSLKPQEISSLLGINVELESQTLVPAPESREVVKYLLLWIISLLVALLGLVLYMYITEVGLFHHTSAYKLPG